MFGILGAIASSIIGSRIFGSRSKATNSTVINQAPQYNQEQANRIKALEDQLKISQQRSDEMSATMAGIKSEAEKYRAEADKTLAAADERLKQFRIETGEADERRKLEAQVSAANRLMEGSTANMQIQSPGNIPKTGGSKQFRRRKLQYNNPTYQGLGKIKSGMVNV